MFFKVCVCGGGGGVGWGVQLLIPMETYRTCDFPGGGGGGGGGGLDPLSPLWISACLKLFSKQCRPRFCSISSAKVPIYRFPV